MTLREAHDGVTLLSEYTEYCETPALDGGGRALVAHWKGGGSKVFYTLEAVREWVEEHHPKKEEV